MVLKQVRNRPVVRCDFRFNLRNPHRLLPEETEGRKNSRHQVLPRRNLVFLRHRGLSLDLHAGTFRQAANIEHDFSDYDVIVLLQRQQRVPDVGSSARVAGKALRCFVVCKWRRTAPAATREVSGDRRSGQLVSARHAVLAASVLSVGFAPALHFEEPEKVKVRATEGLRRN